VLHLTARTITRYPDFDFIDFIASAVVLEDMVLVSRSLEDLKKGLGLGLVSEVLGFGLDKVVLVLVFVLASWS
jgi:hypothetical protein